MYVAVDDCMLLGVFFYKQKAAYEMRISDWSSDVCSSDLLDGLEAREVGEDRRVALRRDLQDRAHEGAALAELVAHLRRSAEAHHHVEVALGVDGHVDGTGGAAAVAVGRGKRGQLVGDDLLRTGLDIDSGDRPGEPEAHPADLGRLPVRPSRSEENT